MLKANSGKCPFLMYLQNVGHICIQIPNLRFAEVAEECLQEGVTPTSQLGCHVGYGLLEDTALRINLWPFPLVVRISPHDTKCKVSRFGQTALAKP